MSLWDTPKICPICKTSVKHEEFGTYRCSAGHMVHMTECVTCEKFYEVVLVTEGDKVATPYHNHKCEKDDAPETGTQPIDGGKTYSDKLRDAELMEGD